MSRALARQREGNLLIEVVQQNQPLESALAKARNFLFAHGFRLWERYGAGVLMYTVDEKLIMQVGASGITGRSDVTDDLSLLDALASFDSPRELRQMQVLRHELFAVLEYYVSAIGLGARGYFYSAVPSRENGGARRCRIVDAAMRSNSFVKRVLAAQIKA